MNKTINPSQGSERFMIDLTLYANESHIRTKLYHFDINLQDHILKTKFFTKYVKTHKCFFYFVITLIYELIGCLLY